MQLVLLGRLIVAETHIDACTLKKSEAAIMAKRKRSKRKAQRDGHIPKAVAAMPIEQVMLKLSSHRFRDQRDEEFRDSLCGQFARKQGLSASQSYHARVLLGKVIGRVDMKRFEKRKAAAMRKYRQKRAKEQDEMRVLADLKRNGLA